MNSCSSFLDNYYGRHCRISRDIVCRKCGRTGHFAKMCKPKQPNKVNTIMQVEEYSDEEVFTLTEKENAHITVEMEGKVVSILIDSGSSINAMDKHTFESLNSSQVFKKTSKYFLVTIFLYLHNCIDFIRLSWFTHFSKMSCSATFSAYNIPGNSTISSIMPSSAASVAKCSFTRKKGTTKRRKF
jgi:hypothetical protein